MSSHQALSVGLAGLLAIGGGLAAATSQSGASAKPSQVPAAAPGTCDARFTPVRPNRSLPQSYVEQELESLPHLFPNAVVVAARRSAVIGTVAYSLLGYRKDATGEAVTIEGAAVHDANAWTFTATCPAQTAFEGLAATLERIAALGRLGQIAIDPAGIGSPEYNELFEAETIAPEFRHPAESPRVDPVRVVPAAPAFRLDAVATPGNEAILASPTLPRTEPLAVPYGFVVSVQGRPMSIAVGKDKVYLTASMNGRVLWTVDQPPSVGGSPTFIEQPGWSVLFADSPRTGIQVYDLTTGRPLADGGFAAVVPSPDGSWAILPPWWNPRTKCYAATNTVRLTLTGKLRAIVADTTPLRETEARCPGDPGFVAAAVSPDGKRYVVARASLATPAGEAQQGVIDLFDATTDIRLASATVPFPRHFTKVAFSASGGYLVLVGGPSADGKVDEAQWVQIRVDQEPGARQPPSP